MPRVDVASSRALPKDNINSAVRSYEIVNSDARGIVRGTAVVNNLSHSLYRSLTCWHFVARRTNTGGIWANYIVVQAYRFLAWVWLCMRIHVLHKFCPCLRQWRCLALKPVRSGAKGS